MAITGFVAKEDTFKKMIFTGVTSPYERYFEGRNGRRESVTEGYLYELVSEETGGMINAIVLKNTLLRIKKDDCVKLVTPVVTTEYARGSSGIGFA